MWDIWLCSVFAGMDRRRIYLSCYTISPRPTLTQMNSILPLIANYLLAERDSLRRALAKLSSGCLPPSANSGDLIYTRPTTVGNVFCVRILFHRTVIHLVLNSLSSRFSISRPCHLVSFNLFCRVNKRLCSPFFYIEVSFAKKRCLPHCHSTDTPQWRIDSSCPISSDRDTWPGHFGKESN